VTLAILVPGQGTLHADTMPWLDSRPQAQPVLQTLAAMLGADWRARMHDPEWSATNRHAQPLVTALSLAAWACIADALPTPAVVAGYSVGELAAFAIAGVFDAQTAMTLAAQRADAMDHATAGRAMGLLAVSGLLAAPLAALCKRHDLALAIRLGDDQAIVGGTAASLDAAEGEVAAQGAHGTRLGVRVASHTPWMNAAAEDFARRSSAVAFAAPTTALVCNHTATVVRALAELAHALSHQIASLIRWDACMDTVAERGASCVLEVGPGTTLAGLWRARHPGIPARSIDDFRAPEAVAAWVDRTLAP
jgi:[acyl-carrier-protein] S-malonyltransferase